MVDAPGRRMRGFRNITSIAIGLACTAWLLATTPLQANAAESVFWSGMTSSNIWKWSGHAVSNGVTAAVTWPYAAEAVVMKSGSGAIYAADNYVFISFSSSYVSVACGHRAPDPVPLTCNRLY